MGSPVEVYQRCVSAGMSLHQALVTPLGNRRSVRTKEEYCDPFQKASFLSHFRIADTWQHLWRGKCLICW